MKKYLLSIAVAVALGGCSKSENSQIQSKTGAEQTEQSVTKVSQKIDRASMASGISLEQIDNSIKPGDNFFKYANGKWLDSVEIPEDKASYGSFQILRDEAQEDVMTIIKTSADGDFSAGSDEQKVGGLYNSFLNMEQRDEIGIAPLKPEFAKIDAIGDYQQLAQYFAYANKHSFGAPFSVGQYVDFKDPNAYMILTWQSGIGLPEREYYFKEDETSASIRAQYIDHIARMFELAGLENGKERAKVIMALETRIAEQHMKKEQTRDMVGLYNKVPVAELAELMPKFPWPTMLDAAELSDVDYLVVTQLDFMRSMDNIIADTDLETWKVFLKWGVINNTATYLTSEFDQANFEFYNKTLYGVQEPRPMWRRGVNLVNQHLGEVVGKVYVKEHFSPEAKEHMMGLVSNLLKAYEVSIKELDWMSEDTKAEALDKLSKFTPKIGYPDKWKDYSALTIAENDLLGNVKRSNEVQYAQMLEKQKGPVQKHEWAMNPQTVNAYYNPPMNEIVFPAAILQPPFFNMEAEDAVNYGGIGAVIGHEIGHGFDDAGSTFDGDGVLRNWWSENDKTEFTTRTKQLISQYNEFEALEGVHVNGEFTLGENIGDLGGISIALKAYQMSLAGEESPVIDGFTGTQRVFLGFGQIWANKYRPETLRNQIDTDPHSPSEFRANGAVRNVPEFYDAFDIKQTDALYLEPEQRVKIW
ncbi:M13-type metalloendopeptidase [Aliiglaciecola sp. LCG003]|uniref:M13 family metallopeptidase n=1 Tax=Aliiglaciecola sp. LCG003 TaxID=3053655 RepID=UPI002573C40E|nr:M13-type metalloendopeptidase [Aliiglaciecola sp. LCG003]WJG09836.1 M13-type metalloendopeptidase [Aliiglaciecola sp. LCG003]